MACRVVQSEGVSSRWAEGFAQCELPSELLMEQSRSQTARMQYVGGKAQILALRALGSLPTSAPAVPELPGSWGSWEWVRRLQCEAGDRQALLQESKKGLALLVMPACRYVSYVPAQAHQLGRGETRLGAARVA